MTGAGECRQAGRAPAGAARERTSDTESPVQGDEMRHPESDKLERNPSLGVNNNLRDHDH